MVNEGMEAADAYYRYQVSVVRAAFRRFRSLIVQFCGTVHYLATSHFIY